MQVGELFVNVGLMGADKLAKGLESANKSLNQIKETGLESAYRLKGVFGQFEDQVSNFSNFGTVLKVFQDQSGISAIELQKVQRGLMGVNVSADETRATFLNLQNIFNTIQRGGTIPAAMSEALRRMNIDVTQIKDVTGFVEKFQKLSKTMDVGVGRDIAKDLNISGTMWQGLRDYTGDFRKEMVWMSESQFRASAKMNAKVNIMRADIESAFAKLLMTPTASKALDGIKNIIMSFIKLLDATMKFADKSGLLELVEKFITAFADIVSAIMDIVAKYLESTSSGEKGKNAILAFDERVNPISAVYKHFTGRHPLEDMFTGGKLLKGVAKEYTPQKETVNNINVTQNIKSTDPKEAGRESHKGMTNVMLNVQNKQKK